MPPTTIRKRQIADGAIDNDKVQAGAGIETSKLADGSLFLKSDGTVPMTANLDIGNQKLVNVATGISSNDAVNVAQLQSAIDNLNSIFDSKQSVKVASTANITISNPGTSTFDGVVLSSGNRILLKNQTSQAENGLYVFNGSSSAMTRTTDMDAWTEVPGAFVAVEEGSTYADTIWLCTSNSGGTLNTTAIVWFQIPTTGLSSSNFVDKETPSGTINGSNVTFTLAYTPISGSEHLYLNGVLQEDGGNDYGISGNTITYVTAPLTGEKHKCSYRK